MYASRDKIIFFKQTANMLMIAASLASCSQPVVSTPSPSNLDNTEWVLQSLNNRPLVEGSNITLNFSEESLGGYTGCNWYGGSYTTTGTSFQVNDNVGSSGRLCETPEGVMEQERAYAQALGQITTYRVADSQLEMTDGAGETLLVFGEKAQLPMNPADLVKTEWRLSKIDGESLTADVAITLNFPAVGSFNGLLGCANYSGTYEANGDDLRVTSANNDTTDCTKEEELQGQETQYSDLLTYVSNYRLSKTELELFTAPGVTLFFIPQQ